jgi:transmembrane sensor
MGEHGMDPTERWLNQVQGDSVENAAADWLLRLQGPAVSQKEKAAFLDWIDGDPLHVAAFFGLFWTSYRAWSTSNANLVIVQKLIQQRSPATEKRALQVRASSRWRYAIAASVALLVAMSVGVVHFGLNGWQSTPAQTALYETPVGKNRTVVLGDNSRLTLGGRTRVEVTLSRKERTVALHEGEAYFEVAKEPRRNFVVHVGAVDVTAVGTAFNINRSKLRSIVTVTEGRVLITPKGELPSDARTSSLYLNAGEQITATEDHVSSVASVRDLPAVISWPAGRLSFRQRALRDAIGDVNRYAPKPLVLAPEVGDLTVTGTLMIDNIGSWVKSLERAFKLKATEESDRISLAPDQAAK